MKPFLKGWFEWVAGPLPHRTMFYHSYLHRRQLNRSIIAIKHKISPHTKLLDLGCGSQPYRKYLEDSCDIYVGMEFSKYTGGTLLKKLPDLIGDAHKIPVRSNSMDAVLLTEVLEHVSHPAEVLHETHRVLKENGRIFVSMPFMFYEHGSPADYRRFTMGGLKNFIENEKIGFQVEEVTQLGNTGTVLMQTLQYVVYQRLQRTTAGKLFYYSFGLILLPLFSLLMNCLGVVLDILLDDEIAYSGVFSVLKKV